MGINAIRCDGMYAETSKTGFGEGTRTSSDFNAGDLVGLAALTVQMAFLGTLVTDILWLGPYIPREMNIDKGSEYNKVRDSFIADKVGDNSSLQGHGGMKYTTVFRGIERDETGILKVHADVIGDNPSGLKETKHVVVEDYKMPQNYDDAMKQYNNLTTNGSTPSMAILDFDDVNVGSFTQSVGDFLHGDFEKVLSDAKVVVYAKIDNDKKASITTAEGRVVQPDQLDYPYNGNALTDGSEVLIYSKTVRSVMPPMPGVPTFLP